MEEIIALKLSKRRKNAQKLQKVLTGFGSLIKTRIGFNRGGETGIILLDVEGKESAIEEFKKRVSKEKDVEITEIRFD